MEEKFSNDADTIEQSGDEAVDAISEAKEDITDIANDAKEDITETANEVKEDITEIANEVKEDVTEISDDVKEDIEGEIADKDSADEDEAYDPTKLKGQAPNSVPVEVKKGRKPLNKTNIIVIVVCAVIVVAALLFVGFSQGWFSFLTNKKAAINLADTSKVEVYKEDIEVTDDDVQYYIDSILNGEQEVIDIESGKLEDGDTANIDYKGMYKDTKEAFEGGTAEGYDLTLGSGTFIEGFEEGLVGKEIGETVELDLTFPEEYPNNEDLAGKDVVFEVKINSAQRYETPDLTDEWVKEYSEKYCPETYETVDDFRDYCKDTVVNYYTNNAIYQYLESNSEIKSYDTEKENELMEYSNQNLESMAAMYGMSVDDIASMYQYANAEEYNREQADNYLKVAMIVDEVCKKNNVTYTDEDLNEAITQYMKDQRYIDQYSQEEFVEQSGDTWLWLFTNLEFRFSKAMQSLKDNVVVLEEKPTTEEDAALEDALYDDEAEDVEIDAEPAEEAENQAEDAE